MPMHTWPEKRFRAFSPETMPHFAENSHMPYAKCHGNRDQADNIKQKERTA